MVAISAASVAGTLVGVNASKTKSTTNSVYVARLTGFDAEPYAVGAGGVRKEGSIFVTIRSLIVDGVTAAVNWFVGSVPGQLVSPSAEPPEYIRSPAVWQYVPALLQFLPSVMILSHHAVL
jgi:hypothetical protein